MSADQQGPGPRAWVERRGGWTDERVAAQYDDRRFRTPLQRRKHANDASIVLELLSRIGGGLTVLDGPTGTGRMLPDLAGAGHRVTGLDLSPAMLAMASGSIPVGLLAGELERMPFQDDAFDAAVSLRFLFHVREPAIRAAILREYARVARWLVGHERCRTNLKHSGRYLRSLVGLSKRYRPAPSRAELAKELAGAGFELVAAQPVSRLFSDKLMFLARRLDPVADSCASTPRLRDTGSDDR